MITPISYADTNNRNEVNTLSMDMSNTKVVESFNVSEEKEKLLNSNKYETITTKEIKELEDGTILEIENIQKKI